MDLLQIVNAAIVIMGVPTILGASIFIGRKLQILDILERSINNKIKPDLKDVRERLSGVEQRLSHNTERASMLKLWCLKV